MAPAARTGAWAALALSAALTVGLAGCTAAGTPEPTPSPDLAGDLLGAICPANAADLAFNAVWSDDSSSLEDIVAAATSAKDADAGAAASLATLATRWPDDLRDALAVMQRMYEAKVADYSLVAEATDIDPFYDLTFHNPTAGEAAYQRVARVIGTSIDDC